MADGIIVYYVYLPGEGYFNRFRLKQGYERPIFVSSTMLAYPYKTISAAKRMAKRVSPRAVVEEYEWR